MKSLLTLAIVLASTSAFATRARVTALGNAPHLVDASTVSAKPADMFAVSDSLTIESGKTDIVPGTDDVTAGAEALLIRSHGDAKWALSLGHDDVKTYGQRTDAGATLGQQNPFEISYGMKAGDMAWAATLAYSNFNNKLSGAEVKENTMGLKFGAATSTWDATIDLGLANKVTSATSTTTEDEFKGKSNVAVRGGFWMASDMYVYGNVDMGGYEVSSAGAVGSEVKTTEISIGAINTVKSEGNEFFWGAGLASTTYKDSKADAVNGNDEKKSSLSLPLIIGVEANAASWLTLRGSVTQNVLIQNEKVQTTAATTTEFAPGENSTTFAAGAGLKLGKLALDGSILKSTAAVAQQDINANDLLGTVGLTYAF